MRKVHSIIAALVVLFLLAGCRQDVGALLNAEQTLTLRRYEKGTLIKTDTIAKGSLKYFKLLQFAKNNMDGWSLSVLDYAPNLLIFGNKFSLNVFPHAIVVGYANRQYEKPISDEDYTFFRNEIFETDYNLFPQNTLK